MMRICDILDKKVDEIIDGVKYGYFPHIAEFDGKIKIFDVGLAYTVRRGWLMPVGIPIKIDMFYVGYCIGGSIYVNRHILQYSELAVMAKKGVIETFNTMVKVLPKELETEEEADAEKLMWQMSMFCNSGTIGRLYDIDFEGSLTFDSMLLKHDGWIANRIPGTNIFYGIIDCPVTEMNVSMESIPYEARFGKYPWFNKYLVLVDMQQGQRLLVYGKLSFGSSIHPHIQRDGELCTGNSGRRFKRLMIGGKITELFIFIKDFLSNYDVRNPYFNLPVENIETHMTEDESRYISSKIFLGEPVYIPDDDVDYDEDDDDWDEDDGDI